MSQRPSQRSQPLPRRDRTQNGPSKGANRTPRRGSGRTLLVTGGAGFLGGHFVADHLARFPDDHVIVLDVLTYAASTIT